MNLQNMSLKELRELAKEKGISGISGLRKAELLQEIERRLGAGSQADSNGVKSDGVKKETKKAAKPRTESKAERPVRAAGGANAGSANAGNASGMKPKQKNDDHGKQTYTYVPNHDDRFRARNQSGGTGRYENRQETRNEQRYDTRSNAAAEQQTYRPLEEVEKAGLITIAKDRHVTDVHPTEMKELGESVFYGKVIHKNEQ